MQLKIVAIICWLAFITGCQSSTTVKKDKDDSLDYYPPTPAALSKQDFRHYYNELNDFFDTTLLNTGFNGSILIAKEGAIIYEKIIGKRDLRKSDSLTESTTLHIASTSKTFTAIAILQLVQKGLLSLQDTVTKFFPKFPYQGVTIKMLLNHRSGLPNYLYFMSNNKWGTDEKGKWNHQFATNQDVLQMMIDKKPDPIAKPDNKFNYCNTNYLMLALIIEKITSTPFPEYMEQKIFKPLQMDHTYIFTLKDTATATPSFTTSGTYWNFDFLDATYGDKNVYTTPRDLLKWDQALYTNQLLDQPLLDSAFKGYSFEKDGIHNYGLGWRLQLLPNEKKIVYHFGKWHGSNAAFARLIDEKATIIIIGNRFNHKIYDAAHLCYDIFGPYLQRKTHSDDESENTDQKQKFEMKQRSSKKTKN